MSSCNHHAWHFNIYLLAHISIDFVKCKSVGNAGMWASVKLRTGLPVPMLAAKLETGDLGDKA